MLLLKLAWRNLWRNRRRTLLVVLAMGVMMSFLVMYDGLLVGFESAVYGNAIKLMGGNVQIRAEGYEDSYSPNPMLPMGNGLDIVKAAEVLSNVEAVLRHANTGGLVSNREGIFPVSIYGIEPEKEADVNPIFEEEFLLDGRMLQSNDEDVVFIGKGLADAMDIGVGDRISMSGKSAHEEMRQRTMTVIGIYDINLASFERQGLYISLGESQRLYDLGDNVTEVIIYGEKPR
jgi:ABC-type lipoprotein release transport system permease subunit